MVQAADGVVRILLDFSNRQEIPEEVQDAATRYGIRGIPVSIFLSPGGEEVARRVGPMATEALVEQLETLVREHRRPPFYAASMEEAVRRAQEQRLRIAVLHLDDSDTAAAVEELLASGAMQEMTSRYVWVRSEGRPQLVIYASDGRTEVGRTEFRSLAEQVREAVQNR